MSGTDHHLRTLARIYTASGAPHDAHALDIACRRHGVPSPPRTAAYARLITALDHRLTHLRGYPRRPKPFPLWVRNALALIRQHTGHHTSSYRQHVLARRTARRLARARARAHRRSNHT